MSGVYLSSALIAMLLSVLGFVLAATVSPGAINMGIGLAIAAALMAAIGLIDWIRGD